MLKYQLLGVRRVTDKTNRVLIVINMHSVGAKQLVASATLRPRGAADPQRRTTPRGEPAEISLRKPGA